MNNEHLLERFQPDEKKRRRVVEFVGSGLEALYVDVAILEAKLAQDYPGVPFELAVVSDSSIGNDAYEYLVLALTFPRDTDTTQKEKELWAWIGKLALHHNIFVEAW